MDFDLDISQINFSDDPDRISLAEIVSVLKNGKSRLKEKDIQKNYSTALKLVIAIKRGFYWLHLGLLENKRQILQIKVADENEIEVSYCKG
jgi:hypothetical protein